MCCSLHSQSNIAIASIFQNLSRQRDWLPEGGPAMSAFRCNAGGGTSQGIPKKVTVRVVQAGFGDCTLLEVLHDDGKHARVY